MATRAHIVGWGKYVPSRVLTNDDLSRMVDTSDEWIRTRTGISERRIAEDGETSASMAILASRQALHVAGVKASDLDLIIVATCTPDYLFPSTACLVQDSLGSPHAAAFDLAAGCSGFVYGLSSAASYISSGVYKSALIIGSETLSRIIDWADRTTCVLFGDGAGAVVLQAGNSNSGILSTALGSDGSGGDLLFMPAGGSREPASHRTVAEGKHYLRMRGREVFRFAVRAMPAATRLVLDEAGLTTKDLKLIVPHQANQRIIQASAKALGIPEDRIYSNLDRYGNTSAASVPIALCDAVAEGLLERDDVIVFVGFGAGLTWAAAAIRWSAPEAPAAATGWDQVRSRVNYGLAALRSLLRRIARWIAALFVRE
jgi:3-oxoacyl-[acyl-carrier-protein] synthase-3